MNTALEEPPVTDPFTRLARDVRSKPIGRRKVVYTLNVPPTGQKSYAPEICDLTYPLLARYAKKIGAEFEVIDTREFPGWPVVYEKLQIFKRASGVMAEWGHPDGLSAVLKRQPNDWSIFIDSDTLVHPDFFDITEHMAKDTVCHNGKDMATVRWKYDQYFRRDGRHIGSCNWFAAASDWCLDLWRPLDDLTFEEALANINPTVGERVSGFLEPSHLIDDYTLSRNIAKFGLKHTTCIDICRKLGRGEGNGFLWHKYNMPEMRKFAEMCMVLQGWNLANSKDIGELKTKWGIDWKECHADHSRPCGHCGGTGVMDVKKVGKVTGADVRKSCPHCLGCGKVYVQRTVEPTGECPTCNGTGTVPDAKGAD